MSSFNRYCHLYEYEQRAWQDHWLEQIAPGDYEQQDHYLQLFQLDWEGIEADRDYDWRENVELWEGWAEADQREAEAQAETRARWRDIELTLSLEEWQMVEHWLASGLSYAEIMEERLPGYRQTVWEWT